MDTYLYALAAFMGVASLVLLSVGLVGNVKQRDLRKRLSGMAKTLGPLKAPSRKTFKPLAGPVSGVLDALSKLSAPDASKVNEKDNPQLRFIRAGIRNNHAPRLYYAIKSALTFGLPLVVYAVITLVAPQVTWLVAVFVVLLVATAGYYVPDIVLKNKTQARADRMRNALPDMIDLLVICTESGLGMDAAIQQVSREMARASPELSEEFHLVGLEIRAGAPRMSALHNLALRVNLEDLYDLVSMLIQADKFGTSLAESLRIQSDMMRLKRMQRAEELAAKVPVKMLLPLIFFIFPVLMLVLLGPAGLQMAQAFGS